MIEDVRKVYGDSEAPILEVIGARRPGHTVISALLAEAGRLLHAGATLDELRVAFGLGDDPVVAASLADKRSRLEAIEGDQYMRAMLG